LFDDETINENVMNLPELPLDEWEETKTTLHLYLQIVGKIRLKVMPRKNHWWNITLYVNARGITTRSMYHEGESFEIQLNFIEHRVEVITSRGEFEYFALRDGLSVAEFHNQLFAILNKLRIDVHIVDKPYSVPDENPITTPFNELTQYSRYQKEYVERFWKILLWVDDVFNEFSGKFYGKTCPVHIYWHHMDMAVTRFSGKKIPLPEGMRLSDKDAYSHEVISFGFWAGDEKTRGAAFYSYTYPSPKGLEKQPLEPKYAKWVDNNGSFMALLMYDDLRQENDPRKALLDFLESSYLAGATLAGWKIDEMRVPALKDL
jgi:hypothetical protein